MPKLASFLSGPVIEPVESRVLFSTIAMFYSTNYVDTNANPAVGDAANLKAQLLAEGETVRTFTAVDSGGVQASLAGADLLVIPALDKGDLSAAMSNSAKTQIRTFLAGGGGLLMDGDPQGRNTKFLEDVFNFPAFSPIVYDRGGDFFLNSAAASGTSYSGGPATVGANPVNHALLDNLPAGSKGIYNVGIFGDEIAYAVVLMPYASRLPIAFLSWNWNDGGPDGHQDNGWNDVLSRTVRQVARKATITAPSALTASAFNTSTINLTWKDNSGVESGFEVERATAAAGPFTRITTTAANATGYGSTGLNSGTKYFYRVRAKSSGGTSAYSNVASISTFSSTFATLSAGTVTVSGTNDNDTLALSLSADGKTLTAKRGGASLTFSNALISHINVTALSGNDLITIGGTVRGTNVQGGVGNDTIIGGNNADSLYGNSGNDVLIGNRGNDSLDGGDGNDLIFAADGATDTIVGGNGTDTLYGDASDVHSLVETVIA